MPGQSAGCGHCKCRAAVYGGLLSILCIMEHQPYIHPTLPSCNLGLYRPSRDWRQLLLDQVCGARQVIRDEYGERSPCFINLMPKILVRFRFWATELLNFAIVEILLTPQHTSYTGE